MNSKLHDAILGLAIGDALGVPYEFEKRGTFLCTEMVGYGTHNQPEGTWSDDTSMVLATLDSLKRWSDMGPTTSLKEPGRMILLWFLPHWTVSKATMAK